MAELFDMALRRLRRDRAARIGGDQFLLERAFADTVERLQLVNREFRSALLVGCPDATWRERLCRRAESVEVIEPGPAFAIAAGARPSDEARAALEPGRYDLAVAVGTLDTVNDLPAVLLMLRFALRPDSLLIGAMSGGETVPRLRAAMRAADAVSAIASPHVHPRIEPSGLITLLADAGFAMPVVDVDRVRVSYPDMARLIGDLRAMAATNLLTGQARRPLTRAALAAANQTFTDAGENGRTAESFEILHFAAWSPNEG